MSTLLSLLKVCIIWHLTNCYVCLQRGVDRVPSTVAPERYAWTDCPAFGHWESATCHRELKPAIDGDLALSLLYVSKASFHPLFDCVVFLGNSDIKTRWAEMFGVLSWDW